MSSQLKDSTPLMRQYFEIKAKYPDTILLYRMGDFYETFDEDARQVHKILGITLTKRANGKASEVALAGFPYHALDSYLPKLIRSGLRVAVCEQVEDPKLAKGIVKRDVIEIVTPGTTLSDKLLEHNVNNFLASVTTDLRSDGRAFGLALIDASTGEFFVGEFGERDFLEYLYTFKPSEVVVPRSLHDSLKAMIRGLSPVFSKQEDWLFAPDYTGDVLVRHFKTHSLKGFGIHDMELGICAAGAAIHYLKETQRFEIEHVHRIRRLAQAEFMTLDNVTLRNLEIFETRQDDRIQGNLIGILDQTKTAMGGRRLRQWITRPLKSVEKIQERLNAVDELYGNRSLRNRLNDTLKDMADLERLISKVCAGRVTPREVRGLCVSLEKIPVLRALLDPATPAALREIKDRLIVLDGLTLEINRALVDEPSAQIKDGNVIRIGYHKELDELRSIATDGKSYIANLQNRERERTGIASLKVNFNSVFGYYIEITHTHKDKVPSDYIRKQTMVNAERFITPELKEYEEKVLTAEDRVVRLEQELFDTLRKTIALAAIDIQTNAALIAELDCYNGLAETAEANKYVKPVINDGDVLRIVEGRHPVVERILPPDHPFIPNDLTMDAESQIHLITGPNMAGKSCYLRQVGLIVLMAQAGSYVPAKEATIGVVDKIFTRVGASDNLAAGESTFLVEMNETANILNNATSRSLILLDEIGRGTSTFDGLSIAWAIVEHLHDHTTIRPKTLFATHYHELVEMEKLLGRVKNYNMHVRKYQDKIIFVRKIVPGGCDHSYGIEVAKLAGLPSSVIERARAVMHNLESHHISAHKDKGELMQELGRRPDTVQLTFLDDGLGQMLKDDVDRLDLESMTPIEALTKIYEWKKMLSERVKPT